MKFIVPSQLIFKNLQLVSGIIATNSAVPITEGVLFELNDNLLRLTATDLETTIITELEVSDSEGSIDMVLPAKIVLDTLKALPDVPVTFEISDELEVVMSADNATYGLRALSAVEFPERPSLQDMVSFEMNAKTLSTAISKTIFATGQLDIRPVMSGVFCDIKPDKITFVATDAHRLVRFVDPTTQTGQDLSFILPKRPLAVIKNHFVGLEGNVTVAYDGSKMAGFVIDKLQVITKLIDGKYPNYEAVIPQNNHNILKIDRLPFLQRMRSISPYADQATHQMRLQISQNEIKMATEDLDSSYKATATIACNFELAQPNENNNSVFEIGFSSKFLQEMLANLDSGEIIIELSLSNSAGLIYPLDNGEQNPNLLMLIMPVMLNN